MKSNDVFPSKYLKAEDLDGDMQVTITHVSKESFKSDKGDEVKPCAYFNETPKGLIVNKTNWKLLVEATGEEDSDNWTGKKVTLTIVDVDAFGDVVSAIRVKKAVVNKAALMEHYQKLWERGKKLKLDGIENYVISPTMTEQEITDLGKELKQKVEAAEAF